MATMQQGWTPDKTALGLMAYAAFQELATRISHRNTGRYSHDPVADKIMVRVAADENLHMMFYRDIMAAALQVDPSAAVEAITEEVIDFDMPGVGIEGFTRKALQMAQAGIYDLRIHHDEILWPLLRYWNLFSLQGLDPQAEQDRERLAAHLARPTGWRAGSRPSGCGPPRPKSARHDLLTTESGCSRLLLGWRTGQGCSVRARGAGREVLDAHAPQQPKRPRRAGRLALPASGPDPQVASRLARAVSPLPFSAPP
jgi:hypothetical protein